MFNSIYSTGAIVTILFNGFKHFAIVSDRYFNGKPMLISLSNRTGTVCEEAWDKCTQGRKVELAKDQGILPSWQVLIRAKSLLGKIGYRLWDQNCEHFARWTHGLKVESKQVQNYAVAGLAIGVIGLLMRASK